METNLLRLKYLKMRTLCIYFAAFLPDIPEQGGRVKDRRNTGAC